MKTFTAIKEVSYIFYKEFEYNQFLEYLEQTDQKEITLYQISLSTYLKFYSFDKVENFQKVEFFLKLIKV